MTTEPHIGRTDQDSRPFWPPRIETAPGSPNVVVVVLDDVGFGQLGCFGSSIRTPHIDRLAMQGLRYTNFHTTALCSPTRASLLTGRNCHSVGFGHVTERQAGFPGYSMRLPDSSATIARLLSDAGYSTWALGKWHLTPPYETGPQGPFDRWPLGRGFDHFYGFLGGSTDQFRPELYRDQAPVPPPAGPEDGYHLSADLVDESIRLVGDSRALAPRRPFFLYMAPGAGHAPHQAPRKWVEEYGGAFDHGWDVERDRVLARQIEAQIMPVGTELGTSNPGVRPWASLTADERRLYARMMEVYAAFLTYTDAQIGRLVTFLEEAGELDNTLFLVLSDNGASGEGGPEGSVDEGLYLNDRPQHVQDGLAHIDLLGGPSLYNHYPWGWAQAGNTPFRWYKQYTHAGGITSGLVVHWPRGKVPAGELRRQYHHVIDLTPTILDAAGLTAPTTVRGVGQEPLHGVSMRSTFEDPAAQGRRRSQHYEMWGNRGYWRDGWMAVCRLQPDPPGSQGPPDMPEFDSLEWELYDHRTDPSECHDLAAEQPALLRQLVDLWWAAAGRNGVLPVDTRHRTKRWPVDPPHALGAVPGVATFFGPGGPYERGVAPKVAGGSFTLSADVTVEAGASGVLYTVGGIHGGYCWYLSDGVMHFEAGQSSVHTQTGAADRPIPPGRHCLALVVQARPDLTGTVAFQLDDAWVGDFRISTLLKRVPVGCGRTYVGRAAVPTVAATFEPPFELTALLHRLTVRLHDAPKPPDETDIAVEMREQ